ncbi:DNA recombination protein RmuC [Myroides guanonis]|uniref:DNA recombination protein RmuC n=1 Tax=Myroides guanonis TaxID=1150112 RepID=A0A1I3TL67_9FLAO|nr:DNA recombination protein RmuC [Myroides guanonis]SFJ70267.1 DNA recombination protein RmuC [Myroides guanonis]
MLLNIIYLSILIVTASVFFLIGKKNQNNKNRETTIRLDEKNSHLTIQLEQLRLHIENSKKLALDEKRLYQEKEELLRLDNQELIARISIRDTEYINLKEKLSQQQKETLSLQERFTHEFENLANKILEEKSEKFSKQNQTNIENLLNPLNDKILSFEQKVTQTHKESIDYHAALRQQIIGLKELNQQMNQETINLTKALKGDNKIQGNWGELILERVLEKSGLEKGREYEVQKNYQTENGSRYQPDVIIHLPDNKKMIIDSKVSLVAYERYINEEDETKRPKLLRDHILSLKQHIDSLASKNYQDIFDSYSPDFVLLFIPIETAFSTALQAEANLYTQAFDKNIVIVTPSTLLATLRTIDTMWNQQKQQENAYEIARQAGLLYDKFQGLIQDLVKVGNKIEETKTEYHKAFNKLSEGRGNLIVSVQKLKDMGAKAKKSLDAELVNKAAN